MEGSPNTSKVFRKRRKHEGKNWQPEAMPIGEKGIYCRTCRKFFRYKDYDCEYEKRGTDIIRLWVHYVCGTVAREDNMEEITGA